MVTSTPPLWRGSLRCVCYLPTYLPKQVGNHKSKDTIDYRDDGDDGGDDRNDGYEASKGLGSMYWDE